MGIAGKAGAIGWLVAALIAVVVAAVNMVVWSLANRPVSPPDWDGRVGGLAASFYRRDQSPITFQFPSSEEIRRDMQQLAVYTPRVRLYAASDSDHVFAAAREARLDVTAGAWIDWRSDNSEREMIALVKAVRENDNIHRAIVGNEVLLRDDMTPRQLMTYLDRARSALKVPVSTAEPWHIWLKYPQLAQHVDFITVHLLPYWEGVSRRGAIAQAMRRYHEVQAKFPGKTIVIGEIGWPSNGDRFRNAIASRSNEGLFIREFLREAKRQKLDYFLMEAFDQPWKEANEGRVGAYWGIFDAARDAKFPLAGPVDLDPDWRDKAVIAALVALLPMLWFALRFRHLRLPGRLFFCALIQANVAVLTWSVSLPLDFYLDPFDWAMLGLLLPAQVAIVAIMLINGFEFTEALWQRGGWRRHFAPLDHMPTPAPKVSIHVPCHNEPPEMVMQTLEGLLALDYPDFEVLVIDNNTRDEAVWKPVQAYCDSLGPRFRFFHLAPWPGFKAGALNYALEQTDPAAQVIAVIDSDYVVRPDWLRALVGYFEQPKVGVVQAPQAHREWQDNAFRRMCNWEYDGFFRIGMHHRNERDAIIQHGTMTMIRRDLMDRLRWAQWCICEDAELGLRVMQAGYQTIYVDEIFGRGVTPADFAAYKTQRFRWAFGAMQILRRHWRDLLFGNQLSRGQRYHFLTGWFSWFADALHLAFTLMSLVWTVGMLLAPGWFALPHQLFLIPVLGFFVAKALFGVVLYRACVPSSWGDTLRASLASMALSHAIARGIFRGLLAREHPFTRTAKRRRLHRQPSALAAVREETLMLAALLAGIFGVAATPGNEVLEAQLWSVILVAQSIPYASAVLAAWVAARANRRDDA